MFAFLSKSLLGTFCSFLSCDSMTLLSSLQVSAEPQCTPNGILCRVPSLPSELSKLMEAPSGLMREHNPESVRLHCLKKVQSPSEVIWRSSDVQYVPLTWLEGGLR